MVFGVQNIFVEIIFNRGLLFVYLLLIKLLPVVSVEIISSDLYQNIKQII